MVSYVKIILKDPNLIEKIISNFNNRNYGCGQTNWFHGFTLPAEFLKWNNPHSIFGSAHLIYHFSDIKMRT